MKIIGKSGKEYEVNWRESGWSYARAIIVRKWYQPNIELPHDPVLFCNAKWMKKEETRKLFQSAIDEYEAYNQNWGEQ